MKKRFIKFFTLLLVAVMLFSNSVFAANKTRYIAVVLADYTSKTLNYRIIKESERTTLACHVNGIEKQCTSNDSLAGQGQTVGNSDVHVSKFVFPGGQAEFGADSGDMGQAQKAIGELVATANSVIQLMMTGENPVSFETALNSLTTLSDTPNGSSINGVTISQGGSGTKVSNWVKNSQDSSHYLSGNPYIVTITQKGSGPAYGLWSVPKGYSPGQVFASKGIKADDSISVRDIAIFAKTAHDNGISLSGGSGFEAFENVGNVGTIMNNFADSLSGSFSPRALGLFTIEELVFNRGLRSNSYYLGMMPRPWFTGVSYMFWGAEAIAIVILFAGIIKLLGKRSIAIMSPTERVDMREGIMNTLIAIVLLVLYPFIFYVMGSLNFTLVEALDAYTNGAGFVDIGAGHNPIMKLVISIFSLFMVAKLNVDYLVRAVSLTVLHVIAPVAIGTMGLSGRRGLFSTWFKELMVNMLMQTFDALILTIILVVAGSSATWLQCIIFTYMFSPLNKWFKDNVMGFRGAGADGAAAQTFNTAQKGAQIAQNQVGTTVAGAVSSARATGLGQSVKELFTAKDSGAADGEGGPSKGKFGLNPSKLGEVGKKLGQAIGTGVAYDASTTVLGNRAGGEVLSGMTGAQAKKGKDVIKNFENYKQNNEDKREQAYNQYDYATQHAGEDYANKLEQVKQDAFDNNEDYAKRYYEDRGYGDWDQLSYDEKSDFMYSNESQITSSIDMDNARQYYEAHPDTNLKSNIEIPGVDATRGWDDLTSSEQQAYMKDHSSGIQSEYSNNYVTTAQQNKEMQNFIDDNANFKWLQNNAGGFQTDSNGLPQVEVKDGKSTVVANLDAEASVQQQSVMHGFDYKTKSFDEFKKSRV